MMKEAIHKIKNQVRTDAFKQTRQLLGGQMFRQIREQISEQVLDQVHGQVSFIIYAQTLEDYREKFLSMA